MTEGQLLRNVVDLCAWLGLRVHHCRPARTASGWRTPIQGDVGFPDLVVAGEGGVVFAELKSRTGRLSAGQQVWRDVLLGSGQVWLLWQPSDWPDRIRAVLEPLSKGVPAAVAAGVNEGGSR